MDTLYGVFVFLLLVLFIGMWVWAWSGKRKKDFEAAAQLPFAETMPADNNPEYNSRSKTA